MEIARSPQGPVPGGRRRRFRSCRFACMICQKTRAKDSLSSKYPMIVKRLTALLQGARDDLGDGPRQGANQRPAGRVEHPAFLTSLE